MSLTISAPGEKEPREPTGRGTMTEGHGHVAGLLPGELDTFGLTSYPNHLILSWMLTRDEKERLALLQGTLDLLILRILVFGSQHGQGIARAIQLNSEDVLLVDHGALYPALQRLEAKEWISAEWGVSSNNRKARFYTLTLEGRKHLRQETGRWRKLAGAIALILDTEKLRQAEE